MSDSAKNARVAEEWFRKGSEAVNASNFDYAVDSFLTCVKLAPEKLMFRQALRAAEQKLYKNNKTGASMAKMKMAGAKMKLATARTRSKWEEVISHAEDALRYNPWDTSLLQEIGQAANALEWYPVGIFAMENAVQTDPKFVAGHKLLAELYEKNNQFDKAINSLSAVTRLNPADHESASKMRQLAASSTIQRGKYEKTDEASAEVHATASKGASSSDDVFGEEEVGGAETFEDRVKREISRLKEKVSQDASDVNAWVQLGDEHRRIDQFEEAAAAYKKGLDASGGGEFEVKIKYLECQIEPLKKNLAVIKHRMVNFDKTAPDAAEKAPKLQAQYNAHVAEITKREVDVLRLRVQMRPEDYQSHIELGSRYLLLKQLDEAIKSLQAGRNDVRRKWEALMLLGKAFWFKKNFALAEKNLGDALAATPENNEDAKKEINYLRGRIAEDQNKREDAIACYNEIAAIDYGFKDVSARLDKLNES